MLVTVSRKAYRNRTTFDLSNVWYTPTHIYIYNSIQVCDWWCEIQTHRTQNEAIKLRAAPYFARKWVKLRFAGKQRAKGFCGEVNGDAMIRVNAVES